MPAQLHSYTYRVLKSTWGIVVTITGELFPKSDVDDSNTIKVSENIYLQIQTANIRPDEIEYLVKGIRLVENNLRERTRIQPIAINVTDVVFNEADYQSEGLTAAIAGWICQEIGVDFVEPAVSFDKATNRYNFDL